MLKISERDLKSRVYDLKKKIKEEEMARAYTGKLIDTDGSIKYCINGKLVSKEEFYEKVER